MCWKFHILFLVDLCFLVLSPWLELRRLIKIVERFYEEMCSIRVYRKTDGSLNNLQDLDALFCTCFVQLVTQRSFSFPTLLRSDVFTFASPTYHGGILVKLRCAKAPRNTGENEVGEDIFSALTLTPTLVLSIFNINCMPGKVLNHSEPCRYFNKKNISLGVYGRSVV